MSHPEQLKFIGFVQEEFKDFFENKKVLEVGSLKIVRSVREFFKDCDYTGVDIGMGEGVDMVIPGQLVSFQSLSFDVTISCECFEHNPFWLETFINMLRLTKPEGLVIISVACYGRKEHGTTRTTPEASPFTTETWDYYSNLSSKDFLQKIDFKNWFSHYQFFYNLYSRDLYFVGIIKSDIGQDKNYAAKFAKIEQKYTSWKNYIYKNMCLSFGKNVCDQIFLNRD